MASFIDDMMVEIEKEKWHDKIIKEVLKRREENNLEIKPEKYKWKVERVRSSDQTGGDQDEGEEDESDTWIASS